MTAEAIFFGLLFSGISTLLGGLLLTRLHWRRDIPPYGRRTKFLDVTLHPEKYAEDAPFGVIRSLNAVGAVLLAGAAVVVTWEILQTLRR